MTDGDERLFDFARHQGGMTETGEQALDTMFPLVTSGKSNSSVVTYNEKSMSGGHASECMERKLSRSHQE